MKYIQNCRLWTSNIVYLHTHVSVKHFYLSYYNQESNVQTTNLLFSVRAKHYSIVTANSGQLGAPQDKNIAFLTCLEPRVRGSSIDGKRRHEEKLRILENCDPYSALAALFKSLKVATSFPELQFRDIYIYLVENRSPYTADRTKAFKIWIAAEKQELVQFGL